VFKRRTWFPTHLFHPPFGGRLQSLALAFYLGKPDADVKS